MSAPHRVALVAGGSGGIGGAVCEALARRGLRVAVHAHAHPERAQAVVSRLDGLGVPASAHRADLADPVEARALVAAVREEHDGLDVVVHAAGRLHEGLFLLTPQDEYQRVLQVNLLGAANLARAAIPFLVRQRHGRIVNVVSVAALRPSPGLAAYASAKAGVVALTRALAHELGASGIQVNAVAPGLVETEMTADVPRETVERLLSAQAVRRPGRAEEIAGPIAWLAAEAPDFLTGQVLCVDGGIAAW